MEQQFFEQPILNSPYEYPTQHWELDKSGQPTGKINSFRRIADFITPIPKPKKRKNAVQQEMIFDEGLGLSTESQQYDQTSILNDLRKHVDQWRTIQDPNKWNVTPETARLLQHWRHHQFQDIRPFFCQVEAVEVAIWLTEVAPKIGKTGKRFLDILADANQASNPELMRIALKLATGAGKTTVMAMIIAWQTINAVRRPNSQRFTRGFLVVTPGITIRDPLYRSEGFYEILQSSGIEPIKLPAKSPDLNSIAERFVKSVKYECLNYLILSSVQQLEYTLDQFQRYYHHERIHQSLGRIIEPKHELDGQAEVQCIERLGGLLKSYHRLAA